MTILFFLNIFYKANDRLINLMKEKDKYWFILGDRLFIIKYVNNVWVYQQQESESATGILPVNDKYYPTWIHFMSNKQLAIQFDLVDGAQHKTPITFSVEAGKHPM